MSDTDDGPLESSAEQNTPGKGEIHTRRYKSNRTSSSPTGSYDQVVKVNKNSSAWKKAKDL